ncbi:MAG: DUF935 family protein [Candidatus Hydrogenedentes bacterium]|nr:DUF935 family protein [Candidatus Hydrogenedentota bacterium]
MPPEKPHIPEVATVLGGRDITRGYVDGLPTLPPTDRIMALAGGWRGYEELLRDDQVQATFSQRRLAVVRKPWSVEPGGGRRNDKRAAELVRNTLETLPWDDITDQMLYARFFGFAVAEILWAAGPDGISVRDIRVRDRARFAFAPDGALRMFTMSAPHGEALPDRKFWVASVGASHHDEPYGRGLANALYWPVWFKRNGAKFWAVHLEKFGAPTPLGKFPKGTGEIERQRLLQALQAMQTDAGVIIPEGMTVELIEATRSGNAGHHEWMQYWDGAIAKTVLGQTMTTDNGSSLAQAQVHMQVREDFTASDADLICASACGSWVRWLVEYNLPGAAVPRVWRETEVQEDLKTRAERDTALRGIGYRITPEAVKRVYGDDYEPVTDEGNGVPPSTPSTPSTSSTTPADGPEFSESGQPPAPFPDQEALDQALDGLSRETLDAQTRALLEPVMRALEDASDDPVAFLGWLAEHYPAQGPDDLDDLLTRLLFVSELWGEGNA